MEVAADAATHQDVHKTSAKLSKLCTRNVNKKLRHRDESLWKRNHTLQKNLETAKYKTEQSRVTAFRNSKKKEKVVTERNNIVAKITLIEENLLNKIKGLEATCSQLKECIEETKIERVVI